MNDQDKIKHAFAAGYRAASEYLEFVWFDDDIEHAYARYLHEVSPTETEDDSAV